MRIWFDADNAPHVLILRPLAERLRLQGHEVQFTARDRASTCELLDMYGLDYVRVGGRYRSGMLGKIGGTLRRSAALVKEVRGWRPDVSFGHGSRALPLASRLLKVPSLTMYDYEWVNPFLFNTFCHRILLPEAVDEKRCREAGIKIGKVDFFPGLKEELYLENASLDGAVSDDLGLDPERIRILLRPPATQAHYHNPEAEQILAALLARLASVAEVQLVFVSRSRDQLDLLPMNPAAEIIVPKRIYDGPSLISAMDLIIGGGGTMTREAAVLGVPAYSFFRGREGRVDQALEAQGRLVMLRSAGEVAAKLVVVRRDRAAAGRNVSSPADSIVTSILNVGGAGR